MTTKKKNIVSLDQQSTVALTDATIMETTPDGFGRVQAFIAREGVRQYRGYNVDADRFGYDSIVGVLMTTEDISKPSFLASIGHSPMTNDHPWEGIVDVTNYDEYNIGECSTDACVVNKDGEDRVLVTLWVKSKDGIAAIRAGKKQLSMGFRHIWVIADGVYTDSNGTQTPYVARQMELECNHVALVEFGKAGEECSIATDGAEPKKWAVLSKDSSVKLDTKSNDDVSANPSVNKGDIPMSTDTQNVVLSNDKVVTLPTADAMAVQSHLDGLKTANDKAITELKEAHETALTTANDSIKTLTEEKATLQTANDEFVAKAEAQDKATLIESVKAMGHSVDNIDTLSPKDIKIAVIKLHDTSTDHSESSEDVIDAVFKMLPKADASSTDSVTGTPLAPVVSGDAVADMVKRQKSARTV